MIPQICISCFRYFLGIPEGKPGELQLYRAASMPPRVGAVLQAPTCLTCVKGPAPTQSPYYGMVVSHYQSQRQWEDEWSDEEATVPPVTPPPRRRRKKDPNLNEEKPCLYHNAVFSSISSSYFVLECLGPTIPTSALYKASLPQPKLIMHLQNNTELIEKVEKMALPQIKTFPVQISGGYLAQVRLYLPPGLREEEITKYPLVVQV